jgi:hypothetical protein
MLDRLYDVVHFEFVESGFELKTTANHGESS